ncbi:MAG: SMC-Scp complex subunit ScpB [Desulfobacterota bacterium]|nr:SMC-Scp complex subunit ScpB [Thermodesulfobacteriota bacterium]
MFERTEIKLVLESFLFSSDVPLRLEKLQEIFPEIQLKELREIMLELKEEYERLERSFAIREVANGFQFYTRPEYSPWIKKFKKIRPQRLSPATMETLAIIAYKQPVTRAEIEEVRGVDTGGIIRTLLEKNLIKIAGKKDVPGKPLLYSTTPKFLAMFGLKNLKELPALEDLQQIDLNNLPLFSHQNNRENNFEKEDSSSDDNIKQEY